MNETIGEQSVRNKKRNKQLEITSNTAQVDAKSFNAHKKTKKKVFHSVYTFKK